jgi:hypothetical protein
MRFLKNNTTRQSASLMSITLIQAKKVSAGSHGDKVTDPKLETVLGTDECARPPLKG